MAAAWCSSFSSLFAAGSTACWSISAIRKLRSAIAELDQKEPDGWTLEAIEGHRREVSDDQNAALVVQAVKAKLPRPWPTPRPPAPGDGVPVAPPPPGSAVYVDNDMAELPPEVQLDAALLRDLRAQLKAAEPARAEAHGWPDSTGAGFPSSTPRIPSPR